MKRKAKEIIHNSKAVFGRNLPFILRYLFFTAVLGFLLIRGFNLFLFWIAFICNACLLIRSIFIFIMDYLDCTLDIPGLSAFRKRCYDRKMIRNRNRLAASKRQREILMPYQTTSATCMPQVMLSDMSELTGSRK